MIIYIYMHNYVYIYTYIHILIYSFNQEHSKIIFNIHTKIDKNYNLTLLPSHLYFKRKINNDAREVIAGFEIEL